MRYDAVGNNDSVIDENEQFDTKKENEQ